METLNTTEPHYIRCVKPNTVLKPGIFENFNVLNQLRCGVTKNPLLPHRINSIFQKVSEVDLLIMLLQMVFWQGVLEAIRISCAGYPTKRSFDEFLDRFGMLAPDVLDGYKLTQFRKYNHYLLVLSHIFTYRIQRKPGTQGSRLEYELPALYLTNP